MPDSTDHIWIFDPREGSFEQCDILAPDEKFRGFRVDEAVDATAYLNLEAGDRETSHLGAEIDNATFLESLIHAAKNKAPASPRISNKERLGGIQIKRTIEQMLSEYPHLKNGNDLFQALASPAPETLDEDDLRYRDEVAGLLAELTGNPTA